MIERGSSNIIREVNPNRYIPTEIGPGKGLTVAALVTGNLDYSQATNQLLKILTPQSTDADFKRNIMPLIPSLINQKLYLFLVLRSSPIEELIDLGTFTTGRDGILPIYASIVLPTTSDRKREIEDRCALIARAKSVNLVYDLLAGYHPSLMDAAPTFPERIELYKQYYQQIKSRLRHNGYLVVQADENNPEDPEQTKSMNSHNLAMEIGLAKGFDIDLNDKAVCMRVRYKKQDGTQGTLYVIKQIDYADGEERPTANTSVAQPDTTIVEDEELAGSRR